MPSPPTFGGSKVLYVPSLSLALVARLAFGPILLEVSVHGVVAALVHKLVSCLVPWRLFRLVLYLAWVDKMAT